MQRCKKTILNTYCFVLLIAVYGQGASMAHTVIIGGLGVTSSIALAQLNKQTGQLSITGKWLKAAGPSPAFMAWQKESSSPTAVTNILIANHAGKKGEAVTAMQLYPPYARKTGLTWTDDPCHIALHPNGRWAVTASYDAGTVGVVEVLPAPTASVELSQMPAAAATPAAPTTSTFLPAELTLGTHTTYPTTVIGQAAHEAKFSPDGSLLYVPCLKSDYIRMFMFDASTGALTPNNYPAAAAAAAAAAETTDDRAENSDNESDDINPVMLSPAEAQQHTSSDHSPPAAAAASDHNKVHLPKGSGPRHIAFHPQLPIAYVLSELDSTITRFDCDFSTGGLLEGDAISEADRTVSMLPPGVPPTMQGGAELAITNDGNYLYASNRGLSDEHPDQLPGASNIVIFRIDKKTGVLKAIGWEDGNGDVNFPRHFSLTPDESNSYLLIANQKSDSVTVFSRDASSGLLTKVCTVSTAEAGVQSPSFVAVVPM